MLAVNHVVCGSNGFNRRQFAVIAAFSLSVLAGCRENPATVNGLVTIDGEPLLITEGMRGSVVFEPTTATGNTLTGQIDKTGHYELFSGASVTVSPNLYLVSVSATKLVPATKDRPTSGKLVTPAKYASAIDSGFRVEVVPGKNEVNLPLVSDPPPTVTNDETADENGQLEGTIAAAEEGATPDDATPDDSTADIK